MAVTVEAIKELRELTGVGMLDCKNALEEAKGDLEKAKQVLRRRGIAVAEKRAGRETAQGLVEAYIHPDGRLGALVELNCETDFVARTDEFRALAHDLAIQVAASRPLAVTRDQLLAEKSELVEKEKAIYREQALHEGKSGEIVQRVAEGRLGKFFQETVLLEQPFVRDLDQPKKRTVEELLREKIGLLGENLVVRRFVRYELAAEED